MPRPRVRALLCWFIKSKCIQCAGVVSLFLLLVTSHFSVKPGRENDTDTTSTSSKMVGASASRTLLATRNFATAHQDIRTGTNEPIRILCYVLLSRARVKTAAIIRDTWGSRCDELIFFGGYEYPDLPVVYLNVSEGYENLWGKAKAALLYLSENSRFKKFHYFLKADDDTFVIVENLRKFIRHDAKSIGYAEKPLWFGFKLKHQRMPQGYMSGGAGYVFNYAALVQVTLILRRNPENKEAMLQDCNINGELGVEDLELGKCFFAAGVDTINTADEKGRERFLPLSYEVFLTGAISSFHWIWRQSWNRVRTFEVTLSEGGQNRVVENMIVWTRDRQPDPDTIALLEGLAESYMVSPWQIEGQLTNLIVQMIISVEIRSLGSNFR